MSSRSSARSDREFLRHNLATLAYRAEKALRDVPPDVASFRVSPTSRTPLEILSHMGDLMEWGARMAHGDRSWAAGPPEDWPEAHARFFNGLTDLDRALVQAEYDPVRVEHVFQGPIADALTHVGQIALLRGLAGAPVAPTHITPPPLRAQPSMASPGSTALRSGCLRAPSSPSGYAPRKTGSTLRRALASPGLTSRSSGRCPVAHGIRAGESGRLPMPSRPSQGYGRDSGPSTSSCCPLEQPT